MKKKISDTKLTLMVQVKRTASELDHRCITDRTSRQEGSKQWVLKTLFRDNHVQQVQEKG